MKKETKIISDYYTDKIETHGLTPEGVDWNGKESQYLRFDQLFQLLPNGSASCADIGCGYGAFADYLKDNDRSNIDYRGYDLSEAMIKEARSVHPEMTQAFHAIGDLNDIPRVDFAIASGIYNVRQDIDDASWCDYIKASLRQIDKMTTKGFAFNILTSYSDIPKRRDYLYYASPEEFFGFCKKEFSRNVALLHDYELYEFTIIVRK